MSRYKAYHKSVSLNHIINGCFLIWSSSFVNYLLFTNLYIYSWYTNMIACINTSDILYEQQLILTSYFYNKLLQQLLTESHNQPIEPHVIIFLIFFQKFIYIYFFHAI